MAEPIPPNKTNELDSAFMLAYRNEENRHGLAGSFFRKVEQPLSLGFPPSPPSANPETDHYFTGDYTSEYAHTCKTAGEFIGARDGETSKLSKRTWRLWRGRMIGGLYFPTCPACQHDHIWRICKQVEHESMNYTEGEMSLGFSYVESFNKVYNSLNQERRKRQEQGQELEFSYCAIPQPGGGAFVIHDNPTGVSTSKADKTIVPSAKPLPRPRPELYELVKGWIVAMPEASRQRTSKGWGGNFKGNKGQGDESKRLKEEDIVRIPVRSYPKSKVLIEGAHNVTVDRKGNIPVNILDIGETLVAAGHIDHYDNPDKTEDIHIGTSKENTDIPMSIFFGVDQTFAGASQGQSGNTNGFPLTDTPLFPKALQHKAVSYSPGGRNVALR